MHSSRRIWISCMGLLMSFIVGGFIGGFCEYSTFDFILAFACSVIYIMVMMPILNKWDNEIKVK